MKWILPTLLLAATLCGCSNVISTRPFGEAPLDLTDQADKWTGTWRSPAGPCTITVMDATNGLLALTSTTPKGWWRWSNDTQHVYLRTGGEWTYASLDCSEGTNTCYMWGKVVNEDATILWWLPDPDKFKPLVESGALPGTIEKTSFRKKTPDRPNGPVIGYTESGDPIYGLTSPSGEPLPTFPLELELAAPDYPPSTEDEDMANEDPYAAGNGLPTCTSGGEIPHLSGDMITLGDLQPVHYQLIASPSNGVLFAWECPIVLMKESARTDLRYLRAAQKQWIREQGK